VQSLMTFCACEAARLTLGRSPYSVMVSLKILWRNEALALIEGRNESSKSKARFGLVEVRPVVVRVDSLKPNV